MSGVVGLTLALLFAFGAFLVYDGLTRPAAEPARPPRQMRAAADRLRVFLRAAGLALTVRAFLLSSLGCGLACAALAQAILAWPVTTVLALAGGSGLLLALYAPRAARRRAAERAALPAFAEQLRAGIGSGHSLEQGLVRLAATGPEGLRPELLRLVLRAQLGDLETALRELRDRLGDPLADEFVAALILAHRVGGRELGPVLVRLADSTRQQLALRQEAIARQASVRLTARIVMIVPVATLVLIRLVAPDYLAVYDSAAGQMVLLGCFAWLLLGYGVLLWLGKLPESPRVLVR